MTYLQLIIDIVFFVTILFLLWQLDRKIGKQRPPVDRETFLELEEMITRSQEQADQFLKAIEEREQGIQNLLRKLDSQEKKLLGMIEQAEGLSEGLAEQQAALKKDPGPDSFTDRYAAILQMIRQGLSPEEVAKRSGMAEGEVNLVVALSQTRTDRP